MSKPATDNKLTTFQAQNKHKGEPKQSKDHQNNLTKKINKQPSNTSKPAKKNCWTNYQTHSEHIGTPKRSSDSDMCE